MSQISEEDLFAGEVVSSQGALSQVSDQDIFAGEAELPLDFKPAAFDVEGEVVVAEPTTADAEASLNADHTSPPPGPSTSEGKTVDSRKRKRAKGAKARHIGKVPKRKKTNSEFEETEHTAIESHAAVDVSNVSDKVASVDSSVVSVSTGTENVETSTEANINKPETIKKRTYKKRKNQVLSKRSHKSKKSDDSTSNADNETVSAQSTLAEDTSVQATAKKYKKRKGKLAMPAVKNKKKKKGKEPSSTADVAESVLNVSMAVVEPPDGDDHLEYEFLHSSPQKQSQDDMTCSPSVLLRKNYETEQLAMLALASDIAQLLDESTTWTVDVKDTVCRLSMLTSGSNSAVERSISWTSEEGLQVYIHNKPLPDNSFLEDVQAPDPSNLSDIAQFLLHQTTVVESALICEGVTAFPQYWSRAEESTLGSIESDIFTGKACFRSKNCSLIFMDSNRCPKCDKTRAAFKKRKNRATNARGINSKYINNRHLTNSLLQAKTKRLAEEKKSLRATVRYLKKKIDKLIAKESVSLDSDTSKDLCKIFKNNVSKMTDLQKLFWGQQLKAISRQHNPRSVRWSPMMIKIALHIQMQSPATYDYLRESGILKLPSQRRLFDFTHFTESKEGIQDAILDLLEEKLKRITKEEHEKYFNLLFDEMTIHQSLVISKNGDIVGFSSRNDIEKSVAELEAHLLGQDIKKEKAKKVLVFMLQGISLDLHEVVAIYPTTELNAQQLFTRVWDVIYNLETRDMRVLSLIFDGASCNKKFIQMHVNFDPSSDFVYSTKNVASAEDRPLFFIVDPPHLLKTIRNCFSNSNGHKHTRDMWKNGQKVSWEAIEKLHSVSIADKYKIHKLTQAHVRLTPFSKMNVNLATQTMSASVTRAMEYYKQDSRFDGLINPELTNFIHYVNLFFDCLNGSNDPTGKRNKSNEYLKPYSSCEDKRFRILQREILGFFQDWQTEVNEEIGLSPEAKERRTISDQSYASLHITIFGFCGAVKFLLSKGAPSIDAKKFNQDKLEQYFGLMRMSGGASNNPTLHEVMRKTIAYVPQKAAALPKKKGNTLGERRQIEINEEALPCKPRKRK